MGLAHFRFVEKCPGEPGHFQHLNDAFTMQRFYTLDKSKYGVYNMSSSFKELFMTKAYIQRRVSKRNFDRLITEQPAGTIMVIALLLAIMAL